MGSNHTLRPSEGGTVTRGSAHAVDLSPGSGKPLASGTSPRGSGGRGSVELAQRCTRVLPEAPNEGPHRLALGDGLPRVEPVTVSTVPLAGGCSATFRPAMESA